MKLFAPVAALKNTKPGVVPHGVNLFEHLQEPPLAARARWDQTLEALNAMPMPEGPRKSGASQKEAQALLTAINAHPLVQKMDTYVPNGGCFARAFVGHLLALRSGYDKRSILKLIKIWESGNITHHVGLALRADDGGWWALDNLNTKVKRLETWGYPGTFATEANRWGPDLRFAEKYSPEQLWAMTTGLDAKVDRSAPFYGGLINDIKTWFTENPARGEALIAQLTPRKPPKATLLRTLADQQTAASLAAERARNDSRFDRPAAAGTRATRP